MLEEAAYLTRHWTYLNSACLNESNNMMEDRSYLFLLPTYDN